MRSPDAKIRAVNLSLEDEALEILHRLAPSPKSYGRFLGRLLFQEAARRQEREKMAQQLSAVIGDGHAA